MLTLTFSRRRTLVSLLALALLTSTGLGMWSQREFRSPSLRLTQFAQSTQQRVTRLLKRSLPGSVAMTFFNGATLTVNSTADTDNKTPNPPKIEATLLINLRYSKSN